MYSGKKSADLLCDVSWKEKGGNNLEVNDAIILLCEMGLNVLAKRPIGLASQKGVEWWCR